MEEFIVDGDFHPDVRGYRELIRCKDCKYRGNIDGYCYKRNNRMAASFVEDDWFCADGERRTD